MKKFISFLLFFIFIINFSKAQTAPKVLPQNSPPKLVVGIVIDQMRWDFLYRYYDRYSAGGFKRLMQNGFNCENTFIPYTPTVTAAGHTCIYTGSVPAIHGITGNNFYDYAVKKSLYCSEDKTVQTVGAADDNGQMSPRNMLVTTICDELKLATNFKAKVIGIALKDRGAILPAGHSADAAYWFDNKTGTFISSTYYLKELPKWVTDFNSSNAVTNYYQKNWNTLYPLNTYIQSDADANSYENLPFGDDQKHFPYDLKRFSDKKNYGIIRSTPYGNSLTFDFAKTALIHEQLGSDAITDFLAISFSSTDYVGHAFGPNSVETEDTYLRLDKDLRDFLKFLDTQVGIGNYTVFLTADHGVAHIPAFLEKHHLPNGLIDASKIETQLNEKLKAVYGTDSLCMMMENYQLYFDYSRIAGKELDKEKIIQTSIAFLEQQNGIDRVFEYANLQNAMLPQELKQQLINGYYPNRCGDIIVLFKPGYIEDYGGKGTTHGIWSPYDAHIPLLFYGNGISKGKTFEKVYMTDIAPTLSSLLHIQMPSGCIGKAINDAIKK
ncbi:MAG: alkaline phosphatase family protein [Bacteroidota bacterium]|nr:alkaline phosphatase family protein [Bacteroidota bacterium]